jgi:hypothetical protein
MAALEAAMRVKSLPVMPSRTSLEECKPPSSEFSIEKWSLHLDFGQCCDFGVGGGVMGEAVVWCFIRIAA